MRAYQSIARHAVSPHGLAALSFLFFLFAWLFPPRLYSQLVYEPDLMFLDPATILFYLLCVIGFVAGVWLRENLLPKTQPHWFRLTIKMSPVLYVLTPLSIGIALCVLSNVILVRNNPLLIWLLIAQQGSQVKSPNGLLLEGAMTFATPMLTGIVWWAVWRTSQMNLKRNQAWIMKGSILLAIFVVAASATLSLNRNNMNVILAGLAVLFILRRSEQGRLTPKRMALFAATCAGLIVSTFLFFAYLRGGTPQENLGQLLGYTVASYNRLAAIVNGQLRYPMAGNGTYLSSFLAFNDTLNRIIPFNRFMGSVQFSDQWSSEFAAVDQAGLNGGLIWSGSFGYIFSDLGWVAPLVLVVYGFVAGHLWKSILAGKLGGVILYPWCAFCILFWFGTNYLLDVGAAVLLLDVIALGIYEGLFRKA